MGYHQYQNGSMVHLTIISQNVQNHDKAFSKVLYDMNFSLTILNSNASLTFMA